MRTVSRTDRASRLIKAPASQIWRAFIDPAALVRWLPPEGMTGEMLSFEARPGGGYRMALHYADADHAAPGKTSEHDDIVEVRFVALNPGREIVQSAVFDAEDPAFAGTMRMHWTLEPAEGGTRVAITCDDVPQGIGKQDHVRGLKSSLANLAAFVEG
ncbi:SRPBCC family protein [Sphingomonas sp. HITSZ_GF]|uniref:SRPBCC family protein n=1 Tax=Sphingomonas sp. HITSZ_GF TaxID=3037247 RepID=UPI00240E7341|nr:SRPBCC family protein [Sphingomonas sp. HITSZ_GF]MDG2534465.1 SRPBCC family protein [Sphingomonas sp. HITSZ_GF]